MKPISLKITGLHSFRELQVVDFAALCEAGLFGIFGPTGSGKSTVLDAVTLALFGKVERAARGTQGIINHAADRVAVELVFELARGERRRRYQVDRVYKRSGDNTAALHAARLVEMTESGMVPLAEKKAVDAAVEELLGLKVDDFTRAVVLPQGKFDEFLKKVRPADRRAMLERLFELEEYGDRLQKKMDRAFESVDKTLAACVSELNGLGDASSGALHKAGQSFEEAVRRADEMVARYGVLAKRRDELGVLWTLQEELAGVRLILADYAKEGPAMARLKESLSVSSRALAVMPLITESEAAAVERRMAGDRLRELREKLPRVLEDANCAHLAWVRAREKRALEEPQLQVRRSQSQRAVGLEEEVAVLRQAHTALVEELDRLTVEKEAESVQGEELNRDRTVLESELVLCLERLSQVQVDQAWRRVVRDALAALADWEKSQEDHALALSDLAVRERAAAEATRELAESAAAEEDMSRRLMEAQREECSVRERCPEAEDSLEQAAVELERLRSRLGELRKLEESLEKVGADLLLRREKATATALKATLATDILAQTQKEVEDAALQVQQLEDLVASFSVRNQAYVLAQTLRGNEPCPVCGSRHHPEPATTVEAARLDEAAGQLVAAKEVLVSARGRLEKFNSAEAAARAQSDAVALAAEEVAAHVSELKNRLPVNWTPLSLSAMDRELADMEGGLIRRREALANWRREMESARVVLDSARALTEAAVLAKTRADGDWRAKDESVREATIRAELAAAELERRGIHLDQARGDLAVENIREEQRLIDYRDAGRLELERKRETLEANRLAIATTLEKHSARVHEFLLQLSVRAERLAQIGSQSEDKGREINRITGGRVAVDLLAETEDMVRALAETEAATAQAAQEAAAAKEALEKDLAVADNSYQMAVQRWTKSCSHLQAALDNEGFSSAGEALEKSLPAGEREDGQKTLDAYQSAWDQATNRERDLNTKLAGQKVNAAEWQACQEDVVAVGAARDRALEEKGALGREYEKIRDSNVRWEELRRTADRAAVRRDKLDLLKSVLRGKAFVDFLAEEQLASMAVEASHRLGRLTNYRYALEIDSEGNFVIRDDSNGGVRRPVSSLSGGETFVASLALALALSLQIQLKGHYPLEFFFLDEGFGTLDPELLEVVVSTLERLHLEHLNIGIISHVPELRNRFPRQLVVCPAEASGKGSRLVMEGN